MANFLIQNVWFVPIYGLIGAVLTIPWSTGVVKKTGPRPGAYLNLLMTLVAFIHGSIVFGLIRHQQPQQLVFNWLKPQI